MTAPEHQAVDLAALTRWLDDQRIERGPIEDRVLLRELVTRLAEVDERTRERMNRLAELDSASEDVLVGVVRALEEQLWMVRAQLPV